MRTRSPSQLLHALDSPDPATKYAASKALRQASESDARQLLPYVDRFVSMLSEENSFLRWDATRVVGHLAAFATDEAAECALDSIVAQIRGPQMIGAATAMAALSDIAVATPRLADRVSRAILGVRTAEYKTPECRNVAIGHAIQSFGRFVHLVSDPEAVLGFVREQLDNPRRATRESGEVLEAARRAR